MLQAKVQQRLADAQRVDGGVAALDLAEPDGGGSGGSTPRSGGNTPRSGSSTPKSPKLSKAERQERQERQTELETRLRAFYKVHNRDSAGDKAEVMPIPAVNPRVIPAVNP